MRNAFAQAMVDAAASDDRVVLLSGDIGNRLFDPFIERFPDRFFNCGVAEANMISTAAGMASEGLRPFCYTIATFMTYRCLEQIRIDVCYHSMPVVIVGTGAGLSYASLGATHHATEDIAIMRALPEMTVVCPSGPAQVRESVPYAIDRDGPAYIRLGKKGEPDVPEDTSVPLSEPRLVRAGKDAVILACGTTLPLTVHAAAALVARGIDVEVRSCAVVKPLDDAALASLFERFRVVVTVEEHSRVGGFGAAVAEWLVDREEPWPGVLLRIGTPDRFLHETLDQDEARRRTGLSPEGIADAVASVVHRRSISTGR